MSDTNDRTVHAYNSHVQEYIDGTPQKVDDTHKAWIDRNLAKLSKSARILELGSAFGRDAAYMESCGYSVERTDATPAFVDLLQHQGHSAHVLNVLTDPLGRGYDMVFANAVLLHFTRDESKHVVTKILTALKPNGRFVFSLKRGDGEAWDEAKLGVPRFFCYWQPEQINTMLREAGFEQVDCQITKDYRDGKPQWLLLASMKGQAS